MENQLYKIEPEFGFIKPKIISMKVDFPVPVLPTIPITSPLLISKLISSKTLFSL